MKSFIRIMIAAVSVLAASTAQAGGTLTTAPLFDGIGLLDCRAVNASKTLVRMTVQVRDYDGAVIDSFGPVDVLPGQITGSSPLYAGGASCVFLLVEGKPKQVRAAANYRDASSNLVIIPAR
jgi:hypothetical protein